MSVTSRGLQVTIRRVTPETRLSLKRQCIRILCMPGSMAVVYVDNDLTATLCLHVHAHVSNCFPPTASFV